MGLCETAEFSAVSSKWNATDHIHLFVDLHPTVAVAEFVQQLKNGSHLLLEKHKAEFPLFVAWSKGYCALTYSENEIEKIINYIKGQKEHHKNIGFIDEMKALIVNFDEYLEQDL